MHFRALEKSVDDADAASTALLGLGWTAEDREDNWLISYADLLSVIFAMVVLLFGRMTMLKPPPEDLPVVEVAAVHSPQVAERAPDDRANAAAAAVAVADPAALAPSAEDRLAALVEQRFPGQIEARLRDRGVELTIPAVALFASARAQLQDSAAPLLSELAETLLEAGDARISVEGHTDNVPLQGGVFDSNWDLAAARANAVTRYLLAHGFDPARLQSVSFADTRPVADNGTAEGRAENRRVELQVELAADAR
jgi:chemotaxis protein MotB